MESVCRRDITHSQVSVTKIITQKEQNDRVIHPLQSWEWGKAREAMNIRVVKVFSDTQVFQMTIHPIPHTSFTIGYIPRSLLPDKLNAIQITQLAKQNKCIFVKIEPYVSYKEAEEWYTLSQKYIPIKKSGHPLFPEWTQVLDLTQNEQTLLSRMKPKTRYNIRLAERKEIIVKENSTDAGFQVFSRLYFETCKRQRYKGHTPEYHKKIWDNLKGSISHILTAYYQNKPLASYHLFNFNKRFFYVYGGSSLEEKNRMAPNLLMWKAIQLGKRLGATSFDMWGSLPPDYNSSNSWAGFTRFKEGYGTSFVHLSPSFDIVLNQQMYLFYSYIQSIRSRILQITS